MSKLRDWDVSWFDITVHVSGKTRGQAVADCLRRAREAGYKARFTEFRARLCSRFPCREPLSGGGS